MNSNLPKYLRINLKMLTYTIGLIDKNLTKNYIGSRGIGGKIIYDEVLPSTHPLSPLNKLIISPGPATGSEMPTGARFMIITKSPLSNGITSSSSGGSFGVHLKKNGYEVLIFEEKSDKPIYIYIKKDKIKILPADELWGKTTSDTTNELIKTHGKNCKVLCIGPGGENLSLMAAIISDYDRACGRDGVGAVMGSKNIKAVVVNEDTNNTIYNLHQKEVKNQKIKIIKERISKQDKTIKNDPRFIRNSGCYRCPIACSKIVKNAHGKEVRGPEDITVSAFGKDLGTTDISYINYANELCNEYGLNTTATAATIRCAIELYKNNYIKNEEIKSDGINLKYGDTKSILGWVSKIANNEGFGKMLNKGAHNLAINYKAPHLYKNTRKKELSPYDTQENKSKESHIQVKLRNNYINYKASQTKQYLDLLAALDSLGLCILSTSALTLNDYVQMANACFNEDLFTEEILLKAGERIINTEKTYNIKSGNNIEDEVLHKMLLKDPSGILKTNDNLYELLSEYYKLRGWDNNGIPNQLSLDK